VRHRMGQRKLEKQTRVCFNFGILNLHSSAILAARNLDVEGRTRSGIRMARFGRSLTTIMLSHSPAHVRIQNQLLAPVCSSILGNPSCHYSFFHICFIISHLSILYASGFKIVSDVLLPLQSARITASLRK